MMTVEQFKEAARSFCLDSVAHCLIFCDWLEEQGEMDWVRVAKTVIKLDSETHIQYADMRWFRYWATEYVYPGWTSVWWQRDLRHFHAEYSQALWGYAKISEDIVCPLVGHRFSFPAMIKTMLTNDLNRYPSGPTGPIGQDAPTGPTGALPVQLQRLPDGPIGPQGHHHAQQR